MGYGQDMRAAAHRHLRAAQLLYSQGGAGDQPGCRAVAGYLFGIAGELAVKVLLRKSGWKPLEERREDPMYAHFPALKALLGEVQGRRAGELRQLADNPRLFQNWDIAMRYAPANDIKEDWVTSWKDSAESLVHRMEME